MKKNNTIIRSAVLAACVLPATGAEAVTAWYQPTPYPATVTSGVHVFGGWFNNSFNQTLVQDDKLQIGGWGDYYTSPIRFDLKGLPSLVSNAYLYVYTIPSGATNPSQVSWYPITSDWDVSTIGWNNFPSVANGYYLPTPPSANTWTALYITPWYNDWKSGVRPDKGILVWPNDNDGTQKFDRFVSSRSTDDGHRPILRLDFTPPVTVPSFKMPLRGNIRWLVTTEAGGYDCVGNPVDIYHTDSTGNYFSVDFSWQNKDANGNQVYGDPNANPAINIPIIAAAGGKVVAAAHTTDNGYYAVINHSGGTTESTGFTTRYLHMKSLNVAQNSDVIQGQLLGYMGSEGLGSTGVHLHFGVRYNGSGLSSSYGQYAVVDGWLMKSFQTECSGGVPIRYYTSSNNSNPQ